MASAASPSKDEDTNDGTWPRWREVWVGRGPGTRRAQVIFQFGGAALAAAAGLAFIFVRNLHRPQIELVTRPSANTMSQALQLGPFILPWTVLVPLIAIGLGFAAGVRKGKAAGVDAAPALYRIVLVGAIAARLAFVWQLRDVYVDHPLDILDIRDGGWIVEVGLIAACFHALFLIRRQAMLRKPLVTAALMAGAVSVSGALALLAVPGHDQALPTTALKSVDGQSVTLSGFAGRPTVVNLWATWCPPCRREMPVLQKAQAAHPEVNFVFVNQGEDLDAVSSYLAAQRLSLRNVLLDAGTQIGTELGYRALPTTLFFDAQGRLDGTRIGELSPATLAQRLDAMRSPSLLNPPSRQRTES